MSRFLVDALKSVTPYTPGEQPQDKSYVKLNTNESPFPVSVKAKDRTAQIMDRLQLYPDPECMSLVRTIAARYGLAEDEILLSNGSDEILDQAFVTFCDSNRPVKFPDITYGFYGVFARYHGVPYREIPLREDFTIAPCDYDGNDAVIFIANPNAPTGLALTTAQVEEILKANPDQVVVIDEAYVDFSGGSCVDLIHSYDNLLVVQTFSKSRSMAGARLGMGMGNRELIADLKKVKYSTNPFNINAMTLACGLGSFEDEAYMLENVEKIRANREFTAQGLKEMGFILTDSCTNFVFAKHPDYNAQEIYLRLKDHGVLVRHFNQDRIADYNRITIGTRQEMETFLQATKAVLAEMDQEKGGK